MIHTQRRQTLAGWAWVSPWLIGFIAFMLLPLGMSLYYSFTDYPMLEPPIWVGWANYARLLTDDVFHLVLKNTAVFAAISIPLCTIAALIIAGLLNTKVRARGFFQAAVFLPTLVPLVASAMIWMWMFNGEYGLVNRLLAVVGIDGPNWLLEDRWVMPALVIISLWSIGQAVVIYVAAFQDVPASLYEAASIDGMGPLRRFLHVTIPMVSPVILFNVITLLIGTLQVFAVPYTLSKAAPGGPDRAMYFYTMYLYDNAFPYQQMGYACAMAWVQLILVLILTGLTFVVSRRFVHYRAM
jgi:multiple sugar transport system permease protein